MRLVGKRTLVWSCHLELMYWELEYEQEDFVYHHQKEYGPNAASHLQRWSRADTTFGILCDDNLSEVWHADLGAGLTGEDNTLITIG